MSMSDRRNFIGFSIIPSVHATAEQQVIANNNNTCTYVAPSHRRVIERVQLSERLLIAPQAAAKAYVESWVAAAAAQCWGI